METDERALIAEMVTQCQTAAQKGVALLLVNRCLSTNMYACSLTDAAAITALVKLETEDGQE